MDLVGRQNSVLALTGVPAEITHSASGYAVIMLLTPGRASTPTSCVRDEGRLRRRPGVAVFLFLQSAFVKIRKKRTTADACGVAIFVGTRSTINIYYHEGLFCGYIYYEISPWEGNMNRKSTIGIAALIAGSLPLTAEAGTLTEQGRRHKSAIRPTIHPKYYQR